MPPHDPAPFGRGDRPPQWGRSSVGRASRSQCEGQGFDSPRLHHPSLSCTPKPSQISLKNLHADYRLTVSFQQTPLIRQTLSPTLAPVSSFANARLAFGTFHSVAHGVERIPCRGGGPEWMLHHPSFLGLVEGSWSPVQAGWSRCSTSIHKLSTPRRTMPSLYRGSAAKRIDAKRSSRPRKAMRVSKSASDAPRQ